MTRKELERLKASTWAEIAPGAGPLFRACVENQLFGGAGPQTSEDIDDLAGAITDHLESAQAYAQGLGVDGLMARSQSSTAATISPAAVERRLRLVAFVSRKALTLQNIFDHSFTPRRRIDWKAMAGAWNKANPWNELKQNSFKVEFCNATRDPAVRDAFFARAHREMFNDRLVASIYPPLARYYELKAQKPPKSRDEIDAILKKEFPPVLRCHHCMGIMAKRTKDGLCAKCRAHLRVSHEPSWLLPGDENIRKGGKE